MLFLLLFPASYCVSEAVVAATAGGQDERKGDASEGATEVEAKKDLAVPDEAAGHDEPLSDFVATAYCLKGRTASGVETRPGIVAADPRVLPLGTIIYIAAGRYSGRYTVMDTGRLIRGRRIDIYIPSYREAVSFGRQRVKLRVVNK